jgi:hypothetical protein
VLTEMQLIFPGTFVSCDSPLLMGLDLSAIQCILDSCSNALVMGDVGLTRLSRQGFLSALGLLLNSLVPKPFVVLAIGTDNTTSLPSMIDIGNSRDSELKIVLVERSRVLEAIAESEIISMMVSRAALSSPLSMSYVQVMEALCIIVLGYGGFRGPDFSISAVSWRASRRLLADPAQLISRLGSIRRGAHDPSLAALLLRYIVHESWPTASERTTDPLLHLLALLTEKTQRAEMLTAKGDGVMPHSQFAEIISGLGGTVAIGGKGRVGEVGEDGWCTPIARLTCACLTELQTLQTVRCLDGELYRIHVYRDTNLIYFAAYSPSSSEVFTTSLSVSIACVQLNFDTITDEGGGPRLPPSTSVELYEQLADLLFFEGVNRLSSSTKHLVCRRRNTKLKTMVMRMSGYHGILTAYRAAMGKLFFSLHVPASSTTHVYSLDAGARALIAARSRSALERTCCEDETAMLHYTLDRLEVFPSLTMLTTGLFHICDVRLRLRNTRDAARLLHTCVLRVRHRSKLCRVSLCQADAALVVSVYDSASCCSLSLRIPPLLRLKVLGSMSPDPQQWLSCLLTRLKVGEELELDRAVYKRAVEIGEQKYVLSVIAEDETTLTMRLYAMSTCITYDYRIELAHIIAFLNASQRNKLWEISRKEGRCTSAASFTAETCASPVALSVSEGLDISALLETRPLLLELAQTLTSAIASCSASRLILNFSYLDVEESFIFEFKVHGQVRAITGAAFNSVSNRAVIKDGDMAPVAVALRRCQCTTLDLAAERTVRDRTSVDIFDFDAKASELVLKGMSNLQELSSADLVEDVMTMLVGQVEVRARQVDREEHMLSTTSVSKCRELHIASEQKVFSRGCKVLYKERADVWSRHVFIEVFQGRRWLGERGVTRTLRFVAYEAERAVYVQCDVKDEEQLSLVLGPNARDLIDPERTSEMLLFLCKYRLMLVLNDMTPDGEQIEGGAPHYRLEFLTDRLYSENKVTPINLSDHADQEHNKDKFFKRGISAYNCPI